MAKTRARAKSTKRAKSVTRAKTATKAKPARRSAKTSVAVADLPPDQAVRAGMVRRRIVNVRANAAGLPTASAGPVQSRAAKKPKRAKAAKKAVTVKDLSPEKGKVTRSPATALRRRLL